MADRKEKWCHVVTQPREKKSKKNSTKIQQKQNALTTILITTKNWVRNTLLVPLVVIFSPYKGHLQVRRPEEPRAHLYIFTSIPQVRNQRQAGRKEVPLLLRTGLPFVPVLLTTKCRKCNMISASLQSFDTTDLARLSPLQVSTL